MPKRSRRVRGFLVWILTLSLGLLAFSCHTCLTTSSFSPSIETVPVEVSSFPLSFLSLFHNDVILAARKSYPLPLMLGFSCYSNVFFRRECGNKPYSHFLFGFPVAFAAFAYPGAIFSDLTLHNPPRMLHNNRLLFVFTAWFVLIQNSDRVYNFLSKRTVLIILTTWWLIDATRGGLCSLERAVSASEAYFSRGLMQVFVWCTVGPILRQAEAIVRGGSRNASEFMAMNSLNAFKYPTLSMFLILILWLIYLGVFADCNDVLGRRLTMVECGDRHRQKYAILVYLQGALHVARGLWAFYLERINVDVKAKA